MMSPALRSCLLALVVLNLVFVHITNAVSTVWMLPLYLGACAAPFTWPLQKSLAYRFSWNLGLMAIFALLVQHIMETGGIRYLLEDGLILAAFCQVHVLNNLGRQRKPDLIFFNSFLIAIVTSFFCQDLVYSLVFVGYATVLILGLQIAATEVGGVRNGPVGAEARRSLQYSALCLALTMLVFIFMPRTFEREGLVEEQLAKATDISDMGFPEEIRLNDRSKARLSNAVIARAKVAKGTDRADVPTHWRGITYLRAVPNGWGGDHRVQHLSFPSLDQKWDPGGEGTWQRPRHRPLVVVDVELNNHGSRRLFAPLEVMTFQVGRRAMPMLDGTFRLVEPIREPVTYRFVVSEETPKLEQKRSPIWFRDHLELYPDTLPGAVDQLYARLKNMVPEYAQPKTVAEIFSSYLRDNYTYLLPGEDGAAKNLDEFLRQKGGGHCEYFAATMVILLRKYDVPCRMVGGYLASEWNVDGTQLTIRKRHAHAWVEAWDKRFGWITVDATPPRDPSTEAGLNRKSILELLWNKVTGFDAEARSAAMTWFVDRARDAWAWCTSHPLLLGFLAVVGFLLFRAWRRWRKPHLDPVIARYQAALYNAGLTLRPGETPRQLLARARAADLTPARLEALVHATVTHERHRYV